MFQTVELPLWTLLLLCAFAAVTFASHFLFPSVRWFFRKRAERLVARLNTRLKEPIQPFKLAARKDTIMRLVHDPEVAQAIADHAAERDIPEQVAFEKAGRYAREIVPSFSARLYFGLATWAARWLSQGLYRVRVSGADRAASVIGPDVTTVFVMNHRSNMDYVLVTWLMAQQTSLAYAVGEWARRWPLRPLIRAMGGYFVRRRDLNPLYRKVLSRYVQIATRAGVTQAVFPEGRLSRDGALQPPKLGILSYILDGYDPAGRDVVFVPVALNYERVLEDRSLLADRLKPGAAQLSWIAVALYFLDHLRVRMTGRFARFGYAAVTYGRPLSLHDFLQEERPDPAAAVAEALMERIAEVLPVLPTPLVAEALIGGARDLPAIASHLELREAALKDTMHPVHHPNRPTAAIAETAIRLLESRGFVEFDGENVEVDDDAREILAFYARTLPLQRSSEKQNYA
ncbi:1-acyl-sn-glycerol-3-phosphate acyltransferase [Jannaschia aquimarina]|uniref:Glycerol-3-phosphate acyltransferase n=1 Tax=Jannaschia aquimarina TaxID=935700 RepID=A0A0D1DCD2_9RHOB|nr:1-acyl-sn-glycerol-3-phosphate acyltransferase [Jannaschia aquimarina]KIT17648.1 Glycerol-3-phosphate acyltransferase [Jannaschia aquimarina]SNS80015.1 glycerol-3-phosphate acyltransferase [Jannaschia aquimarina]